MKNMTGLELYIAYLKNELSAEERHALQQKLVTSETARRELDRARDFLAVGANPVAEPRKSVLDSVRLAFRRQQQRVADLVTNSADLEFDSWENVAMGSQRGQLAERQMLYTSGSIDLDIQLAKDENKLTRTMQGQLLSAVDESMSGVELHLVQQDGHQRRVLTDELGRFRFSHLNSGRYDLQVRLTDRNIRLDIEA